jgi:hypothetical protein
MRELNPQALDDHCPGERPYPGLWSLNFRHRYPVVSSRLLLRAPFSLLKRLPEDLLRAGLGNSEIGQSSRVLDALGARHQRRALVGRRRYISRRYRIGRLSAEG